MWWAECLKRSASASGVAVCGSGVHVCTLVTVPFPSHSATHQVCWWHVRVTVLVSGGRSRTVQSVTFSASFSHLLFWRAGELYQVVRKLRCQGVFIFLNSVFAFCRVSYSVI